MHTRDLIRRLIRQTASRELDTAPVEVVAEMIDVANKALSEVWLRMPAELRNYSETKVLLAPTTVSVAPYHGGRFAGGTLNDWIGCAIQMPDDPQPNRLVSANTLERAHVGNPSNNGVAQNALVWNDAIHIDEFVSIVGEDIYIEMGGQHSVLQPWPYTSPVWGQLDVSPNTPNYYALRPSGFTAPSPVDPLARQAGMPQLMDPPPGWFLTLLPRPATSATLRYKINVQGETITVADYRRNAPLRLPSRLAAQLEAIASQKLAATRLWIGDAPLREAINTEGERARGELSRLVSSHVESGGGYGTPAGW